MTDITTDRDAPRDGFWLRIIYIVSALICAVIAFLIFGPRPEGGSGADVSFLPTVNATFNAITAVLLCVGLALIKKRKIEAHRNVMLAAFASSGAFLVSYVVYHWFKAGPKPYVGDYRSLYLVILLTHIVLATAILPLALVTLYRGWNMQRERHRKIARITFPIWLYVSITGVVIYAMLYR